MYVSNLSFNTGDAELQELFEGFGTVISAKVIADRETGRSRGFGFVEMSDAEARTAMSSLQDKQLEGRAINISEAKPRTNKNFTGSFNENYGKKNSYSKW
jgi:RNA recognition motif-containing protein